MFTQGLGYHGCRGWLGILKHCMWHRPTLRLRALCCRKDSTRSSKFLTQACYYCAVSVVWYLVCQNAGRKSNGLDFIVVFHNEKSLQRALNLLDNVAHWIRSCIGKRQNTFKMTSSGNFSKYFCFNSIDSIDFNEFLVIFVWKKTGLYLYI